MIKHFNPDKNLENWVDYIWMVHNENLEAEHTKDIIMPLCHINVIFNFADEYYVEDNNDMKKISNVAIIGLIEKAKYVYYGKNVFQIGISFKLTPFAMSFIKEENQIIDKVFDGTPLFNELYYSLCTCKNIEDKILIIWKFLEEFKAKHFVEDVLISHMLEYIENHLENFRVKEMADEFNTSISTIERKFKNGVGILPKTYANIKRFMKQNKFEEYDKKALDFYYDQAHLIKDTRKYTNKTPQNLHAENPELTLTYIFKYLKIPKLK